MDTALLDNEEISLYKLFFDKRNYLMFKENRLMLREASKNKMLRCKDCNELLVYAATEKVIDHFKHSKGNAEKCNYNTYSNKMTKERQRVKTAILESMIDLFSDLNYDLETKISSKSRSDIILKFGNNEILALDYIQNISDIEFEEKNQYYIKNGIKNIWFFDIKQKNKMYKNQEEMDFIKRAVLNESEEKVLSFIDIGNKKILLESEHIIKYENTEEREIITKSYEISNIKIDENGSFYEYKDYANRIVKTKTDELKLKIEKRKSILANQTRYVYNVKKKNELVKKRQKVKPISKSKANIADYQINEKKLEPYSRVKIIDTNEMETLVDELRYLSKSLTVDKVIDIIEGYNNKNYFLNYKDSLENVKEYAKRAMNDNYDDKEKYRHLSRFKFLRI